ncbi:MAG: bifunctional phosphopantothenoylcysteine decarboxylase/phosphopantothenate--cysteine ligase CoaBC [Pseudomonadota bacterium]|nr:bifunctional phosphopantothenoylcysteine decarboxylase/phosphopantothenate--cysteine ligase CoaBC [Pseudomonadota bacterium]MDE3037666.1 bifunctional phosphopantothenoylcysteine decarboxylase/phosphopantothenate--cysteine ligase CoaBC [Pseudomonadota bacterium]
MRNILLIISGSIAAYKSLDLIRRLRERECNVRCILTKGGAEFITPLSVASLSGNPVYGDLFSLKDETEMGHIRLTREADVIVVAPASADLIAKMAHGFADDLATAALLASDKKILVAPAMNAQMWKHPATQRNLRRVEKDGAVIIPPSAGSLACGEIGAGRLAEAGDIVKAILDSLSLREMAGVKASSALLSSGASRHPLPEGGGFKALVTSGPTHESIDPVRYLGNRSSGKQGHAIAAALAEVGGDVTLITGPTALPDPEGVRVAHVTSASEMLAACEKALPVNVAVCAAAVSDWRAEAASVRKLKKRGGAATALALVENPDILGHLANHPKKRPILVIGFAAETENLLKNAATKRKNKNADWIVANDVSGGKIFGSDNNEVTLVTAKGGEEWPRMSKEAVAEKLVERIVSYIRKKK